MRLVFLFLAFLGVVGIALGVLDVVRGAAGPHGVPFNFENYGGPGSMIAGLMLDRRRPLPAVHLAGAPVALARTTASPQSAIPNGPPPAMCEVRT